MEKVSPMQAIRTAAIERRCLELCYGGSWRVIEPYSLRTTLEGDLLLCARKRDTDELRTYRVDRIEDIRLTDIRFDPLYNIEITGGGPILVAPPQWAPKKQRTL